MYTTQSSLITLDGQTDGHWWFLETAALSEKKSLTDISSLFEGKWVKEAPHRLSSWSSFRKCSDIEQGHFFRFSSSKLYQGGGLTFLDISSSFLEVANVSLSNETPIKNCNRAQRGRKSNLKVEVIKLDIG